MKDEDRRLLPPMATLHAFAAAARAGSFSRAAAEIGLTQGAISRQIAVLEDWLGRPLFDRRGRRVALNAAGRAYADGIAPALTTIRRATRDARAGDARRVIELATLPSFAMRWLAPRLPRLSARHPDIVVNLTARSDEFDFAHEPFDAAIHFGRPEWPGAELTLLFRETSVPVIGPKLVPSVRSPRDLLDVPLLTLSTRPDAWREWLALTGVVDPLPPLAGSFSQFLMLAQAVGAGAGAALIPRFLVEPELADGSLIAPFNVAIESADAYWLAIPNARVGSAATDLRTWLLDEVAGR